MEKIITRDELNTKTLAQLIELYNEHAVKSIKIFSCAKAKAVDKVYEILPIAKGNGKAKVTKVSLLVNALKAAECDAKALMSETGFDQRNLGVSISILRKKGVDIRFNRETKLYSLAQ